MSWRGRLSSDAPLSHRIAFALGARGVRGAPALCKIASRIAAGPRNGYVDFGITTLVVDRNDATGQLTYSGYNEVALRHFLVRACPPGGTVIDVGANIGLMTTMASLAVGEFGTVIAVEPNPAIRTHLERHTSHLPQVRVVPLAVGDAPDVATLMVPRRHSGAASLRGAPSGDSVGVDVEVQRLDDIVPDDIAEIDVLKLDVEGFEDAVIAGAENTLRSGRVRNIFVEYTPEWGSAEWIDALFEALGPSYSAHVVGVRYAACGLLRVPTLRPFDRETDHGQVNLLISRTEATA